MGQLGLAGVGSVPAYLPDSQPFHPLQACGPCLSSPNSFRVPGSAAEGSVAESASLEVALCMKSTGVESVIESQLYYW